MNQMRLVEPALVDMQKKRRSTLPIDFIVHLRKWKEGRDSAMVRVNYLTRRAHLGSDTVSDTAVDVVNSFLRHAFRLY